MRDDGSVAHNEWHPCACSPHCQAMTKRVLALGHNRKLVGWLRVQLRAGTMTPDEVRKQALSRGATAGTMSQVEAMIRRWA